MIHSEYSWIKELPLEVMVCDTDGVILEMNDEAEMLFAEDGGRALIGKNVLDCHPEPARGQLEHMMDKQLKNIYTIEKNGKKKLIYQTPWYKDGAYFGFVELSIEIPFEMPHFVRD
ncbi:MAG: PAS domain-containing protein [Anaerolineales bacterium]|nr:PAS domain-containing protein [Anaerolineales bacterium]